MSANGSGCLRCDGRTFSEAELQIVAEVVANGGSLSRAQLMGRVWSCPAFVDTSTVSTRGGIDDGENASSVST